MGQSATVIEIALLAGRGRSAQGGVARGGAPA